MHSRKAERWIVRRNGDVVTNLQPLRVEESSGGKRMDFAELIVDPGLAMRMEDYTPLQDIGSQIEIEAVGGGVKHVGIITQVIPQFSPQGEVYKFISQTRDYLFGNPAGGVLMFDPTFPPAPIDWNPDGAPAQPEGRFKLVDDPIVFNPELDGRIFGNMHSKLRYGQQQMHVFLDPDSVQTAAGERLHQGQAISWTLSKAVHYLCWALNPLQVVIRNPSLAKCVQHFTDSVDLVRNVQIDDGLFLTDALDSLINPLGYHWRLNKQRGRTSFDFFRRGSGGKLVWLNHQRFGEVFDKEKTNVEAQGVAFDAGRLANQIIGRGSKLQIEITVELCRGWLPAFDEYARDDLKKTALTADVLRDDPGIEFAWRRWVLNEGGDYIRTRPEITEEFPPGVKRRLEAAGFLQWMIPRRREFKPTLTLKADGEPIGATKGLDVEWSADGGENWSPVGKWQIDLLEKECGLYFGFDEIPEELIDAGDDAKVRVTATIETDFRISAIAERQAKSPLTDPVTAIIDLERQFHWREVTTLSKYKSGNRPSLAEDDRDALQSFVEALRDRYDNVDVAGAVTLEGVDQHQYRIGDRVAGVKGKNISFRSRLDGTTYPQIAAITYDIEGQKTILHMQRVRETVVI